MTYSEASAALLKYPCCIAPAVKALPNASPEERVSLLRRIAVAVGDTSALRAAIGLDPADFANFYPDMEKPDLSTEDTIDSFIDRFASKEAAATPTVDDLVIAAPAIDYLSTLEEDEVPASLPDDDTSSAIDAFLAAVPPKSPRKPNTRKQNKTEPTPTTQDSTSPSDSPKTSGGDDTLSLSLAKIMIKQGNYHKALEIINDLNLNNPKKSIYFADQIRFLNKLIQNQANAANADH